MFARLMGLKTISPSELQELIEGRQVNIFDVNSRQSWMKAHVPGARNVDPVGYPDDELPQDRSAPLVFYCSNPLCRKAPNAARRAKQLGYRDVKVMSAGISGWLAKQLPTEAGE